MKKLILNIRGHVRRAFNDINFYNLIKEIESFVELDIYLHTWNIFNNGISGRKGILTCNNSVSEEIIKEYFNGIKSPMKIKIESDKDVIYHGSTEGFIYCETPRIGWKAMWHGMNTNIDDVIRDNKNENLPLLNMRIDILNFNSDKNKNDIINFIKSFCSIYNNYMVNKIPKNIFMCQDHISLYGIDSMWAGSINTSNKLIKSFYHNADEIVEKYKDVKILELIVALYNNEIKV